MPKPYDNTNRGMLFRVSGKKESERHPDLNGRINIDGVDHWLSGWWKKYTDKDTGEERTGISLSLGAAVKSKSEAKRIDAQTGAAGKFNDMEDDIPF